MPPAPQLYHPVTVGSLRLEGNLFLAPVAGYSDRAFRSVCIEGEAAFCCTEMISAEGLVRNAGKTEALLWRADNETQYGVQIFGGNPEAMSRAAEIVAEKTQPSLIDINAGCPVPKVVKTGAGAALTRDPDRLFAVTAAVVTAVSPLPVTVKIRSGWTAESPSWKEAARAATEAGANAITIHPRTRAAGYGGSADWGVIAELAACLKGKGVPVFGSGDVFSPEDARRMLETTGADAVTFARGALGNPFIFRETRELLETGAYAPASSEARIEAGFRELERLAADEGEEAACRKMRKRFCAYSKGIAGGAELRKLLTAAERIADYRRAFQDSAAACLTHGGHIF